MNKNVFWKIIAAVMVIAMVCGLMMSVSAYSYTSSYSNYDYNTYGNGYNSNYGNNYGSNYGGNYGTNYGGNYTGNYGSNSYYSEYYPNYDGNSYYNGNYNYNYNNQYNTGYYGYYNNNYYYDYYGNSYSINNYNAEQWFNSKYGNRFKFYWIKNPLAPAIREDYFRAVYDMQMSYNSYNNYPQGNPQRFADFYNYSHFSRLIAVLNGTGGSYVGNNILDGRLENGQQLLDFNSCITRAEAAKLCIMTNNAWWNLPQVRAQMNFEDTQFHWANNQIANAYALGIVDGVGWNQFDPDNTLTNQEMLTVFCNVLDRSNRYDVKDFINMVNAGNVARITEAYYANNSNPNNWYFTKDTVYVNMDDTFELNSIMSGNPSSVRYEVSNSSIATVDRYGNVSPRREGTVTITATDSYGYSDQVTIIVQDDNSYYPEDEEEYDLRFNQSVITIQRGSSVNLEKYLENASGYVNYTGSNQYVSVSGNTATGIAVGYATITASCNSGVASVQIQVVDSNVRPSGNVNPRVNWSDNGTTGNLNFTITGIDATCEVRLNENSNYTLKEDVREATWGKYQVLGLYPEGGTDTIIVGVYQNGIKVWESERKVWYTGD